MSGSSTNLSVSYGKTYLEPSHLYNAPFEYNSLWSVASLSKIYPLKPTYIIVKIKQIIPEAIPIIPVIFSQ